MSWPSFDTITRATSVKNPSPWLASSTRVKPPTDFQFHVLRITDRCYHWTVNESDSNRTRRGEGDRHVVTDTRLISEEGQDQAAQPGIINNFSSDRRGNEKKRRDRGRAWLSGVLTMSGIGEKEQENSSRLERRSLRFECLSERALDYDDRSYNFDSLLSRYQLLRT